MSIKKLSFVKIKFVYIKNVFSIIEYYIGCGKALKFRLIIFKL